MSKLSDCEKKTFEPRISSEKWKVHIFSVNQRTMVHILLKHHINLKNNLNKPKNQELGRNQIREKNIKNYLADTKIESVKSKKVYKFGLLVEMLFHNNRIDILIL